MFNNFYELKSNMANIEICERTLIELEKEKASIEKQIERVNEELETFKKAYELKKV